ncbi:tyrosine-type recombinase/integrase [Lipingzhangella rawalii]|uniref:tyrosine-type recombinase/integrase n=1 Tax=Lipingzhangella rawalii TaxID=2055835 RepID=UPI003899203D
MVDRRGDDAHVFTTKRSAPLRIHNWRIREFNKARTNAGLDGTGLTPHKLRHTAASLAIAAGADVKVVQQMLGHATATMTLDTYGHLFPRPARRGRRRHGHGPRKGNGRGTRKAGRSEPCALNVH